MYNSEIIYHYFNIDIVINKSIVICMIFAIAKHFSILSVERYYNHEWHLEKKLQLKRQLVRKFEQLEGKSSNKRKRERGGGDGE